uniref:Neprosin PEP catalytic domain-containing protein n=1 Tax=Oryza brachyantha TaxID=4533 RepID=J3MGX9_ORYBR
MGRAVYVGLVLLSCCFLPLLIISSAAGNGDRRLFWPNQAEKCGEMGETETAFCRRLVNGSNWVQRQQADNDAQNNTIFHEAGYITKTYEGGRYGFIATMDVYGFPLSPGQLVSYGSAWIITDNTADVIKSDLEAIQIGWRDAVSGDWLLHYGFNQDPQLIGRIPMSFFRILSDSATNIWFGGMVVTDPTVPPTPLPPPMGSGYMAVGNGNMAASMKNLQFIDEQGQPWSAAKDLVGFSTMKDSYTFTPMVDDQFFYGGPVMPMSSDAMSHSYAIYSFLLVSFVYYLFS